LPWGYGGAANLCMHALMEAIRAATLVLAIASALAALLCLGGAVSGRLDIFTHFAPFYLAGAAAALLIGLAGGPPNRVTLICAGLAVAICGLLVVPELIARLTQDHATPGARTLKIVQFNLWDRNTDAAATARWIAAENPDIVVVEEAQQAAASIPIALKGQYPFSTTCDPPRACPTTILSKLQPSAGGGLASPGTPARWWGAWATFPGADGFTVIGTHYRWPFPPGPQAAQAARLAEFASQFDRRSLIVAGDFNSTPWSFFLRRQDARFGLERRTRAIFTWPAAPVTRRRLKIPGPFLPIDHIYAGQAWRTVSARRGPKVGSDHFPVVVVLTRP